MSRPYAPRYGGEESFIVDSGELRSMAEGTVMKLKQDLASANRERLELLGYVESLTSGLKRVEGENEALRSQVNNSSTLRMSDGNSVQMLEQKNDIINTQQQQIVSLQRHLESVKDINSNLTRSMDLKEQEIASLKSQLLTFGRQGPSARETELASALQLLEQQRASLSAKVNQLEREAEVHRREAAGHLQALQQIDGNDAKKNMQLAIQLEVAQKEARVAHSQLIKLRSELQALKDAKTTVRDEEMSSADVYTSRKQARTPGHDNDMSLDQEKKALDDREKRALEQRVQDLLDQIKMLVELQDEAQGQLAQQRSQLDSMLNQLQDAQGQLAQQTSQLESTLQQLQEKERRIAELEPNELESAPSEFVVKKKAAVVQRTAAPGRAAASGGQAAAPGGQAAASPPRGQAAAPPPGDQERQILALQDELLELKKKLSDANSKLEQLAQELQRSAAPPPGGQGKQIVGLQDELREQKQKLSDANIKLEQQAQELQTMRNKTDSNADKTQTRIQQLQEELDAARRDLETKLSPPPEVKKEMVLNLQELQPLLPKVLPVSRRPPHPLQRFDAPIKFIGASSSGAGVSSSPAASPAKTSKQQMAEVRAQLDELTIKQKRMQQRVDDIKFQGAPQQLNGVLTLTIHGAESLPKMNMTSHADPYFLVQVEDSTKQTKKLKNQISPTFEETFEFQLQGASAGKNVNMTLMEWSTFGMSKDKAVGTVTFPLNLCNGQRKSEQIQSVDKPGGLTKGSKKTPSMLVFTAKFVSNAPAPRLSPQEEDALASALQELSDLAHQVREAEDQLAALGGSSPGANVRGPWHLRLGLIRAQHLPKMDLMGKADPYVILRINGQEQKKSKTIKNTLNPEWNEEFVFDIKDDKEELVLTFWDWDMGSKDDLIGEVRLMLADLSGKSSTSTVNIMKQGTQKFIMGHDNEKSTVTLSLSASNAIGEGDGSATRPADPSVPLTVSLKLDAAFDDTVGDHDKQKTFQEALQKDLAEALAVEPHRFLILNLQRGSVIVDINILPDIDITKSTPEILAKSIMDQVASMNSSALGKLPTTSKIIGCTLQNRQGQLEAENAFLLGQNGVLTAALTAIEKVQKLQQSEKVHRMMFRWKNRGLTQSFMSWKNMCEREALARELKEQADKDLASVGNELDATKRQLEQNSANVKEQLEMLKKTRESALEDIAKAEQEKVAAEAAAREVAEKQHELEAKLRKKLAEMKLKGGGPRVKILIKNAEHLPKVDTFGWIDAYLSVSLGDETHKTQIKKKQENPEWNENLDLPVTDTTDVIKVLLFDWEMTSAHRVIGELTIKLSDLVQCKTMDKKFEFKSPNGSILQGKQGEISILNLAVTYEEKNDAELEAMQKEMQELERQKLEKDAAVLAAKEKLVIKPPLKIKVHIKSLRHLPKMDMMGKCDGYVVVQCGEQKQQTNKVKDNYDPDFNETFEFVVSKSSQSLSITVMDWESSGKDELVGRAQIPVGKLMAGTVDHELTLIGEKNQDALIGNDKQKTTVLFSLTAEHLPPPPDGEGGGDASVNKSAPWKLIVKLDHAESLPKMDVMGKCDGYVVMSCGGERKQSKTIKNEYNPQWNEEFEFDITDNSDDFIAKIWDWDLGQQDDEVGSVRVPVSELQGKEAGVEKVIVVEKDGQMVTGHDKKPTKIALRFFAKKIEGALAQGVNQDGASQDPVNGKLTILVRRADGLPKMDSWSGKADPYLSVTVDGMTQKTTCKKKTLEPVWDETLVFSNCIANKSIVKVEMFDWESTAKDRTMGFVSVPVRNLLSYDTETYSLDGVLHDGKPTCGKVYMKFSFVPTPQDGSPSIDAQEPGVWVKVNSANNLPKTDMTGKCDPLVNIEVDGQGVSTEHQVNCYDAVYTEVPFHFPESTSSSIMSVTVFDYNKLSGNKPVGFCSVDLSNAGKNGVLNKEFNVVDIKGSPVIGNSGKPCTVALSIKINAMPDEDGDEDSDEGEGDEWDVEVTAVKFSSMPKMDVMGSCDAYLKFSIQNQERRTKEVTGYEGAWNEAFSWDSINGRNSVLAIAAWDKDLTDKDDLIGQRTVKIKEFIRKEKEKKFDLLDKDGKLVKGNDGKTTTVVVRLKAVRTQKAGSLLTVPGMKPTLYTSSLSQLCETLSTSWTLDLTLIQAERLPKMMQPFVELSICDARTGGQLQVTKCPKATTCDHVWSEGLRNNAQKSQYIWDAHRNLLFTIDNIETQFLQLVLIQKSMSGNKPVGFIKCLVKDILVFYLANKAGAVKSNEVSLEVVDANKSVLKDENGFKSKIKLRIAPKLADDIVSGDIGSGLEVEVEKTLKTLWAMVDYYIWSETKFQDWVHEKRDAQAGDIFSKLEEVEQIDPLPETTKTEIITIRERLQSARGDCFTTSQIEIFFGILATLVQMLILKLLMLGN